jgi:predicted DNA-binding transcriptional regulator AlpA
METNIKQKLYTIDEITKIIPMSKAGIYKVCSEGKIPTVKVGKRVFIPGWYVSSLLDGPETRSTQ